MCLKTEARRYRLNAGGKRNGPENGNKTERNANGHTVLRTCNDNRTGPIFLNVPYIHSYIAMYSSTLAVNKAHTCSKYDTETFPLRVALYIATMISNFASREDYRIAPNY